MIRTALRTTAVAATLTGAALMAGPAFAGDNHGTAIGNNTSVNIIGGYGVTCGSVSVAGQSGTSCNGNDVLNAGNLSKAGGLAGAG